MQYYLVFCCKKQAYILREICFTIPSEVSEREIWIFHLEITGPIDVEHMSSLVDPRIWVGHFHKEDFIIVSDELGDVKLERIGFKTITKFRDSDTGQFSLLAPPRPVATKSSVLQFFFLWE